MSSDELNSQEQRPVATLRKVAQARFMRWHREHRKERDALLAALHRQTMSALGRANARYKIYERFLTSEVVQRALFYGQVAKENDCLGMLAKTELDRFGEEIKSSVESAAHSLQDTNLRDFNAANAPGKAGIEAAQRRVMNQLLPTLLTVIHTEIEVLRAEGEASALESSDVPHFELSMRPQKTKLATSARHGDSVPLENQKNSQVKGDERKQTTIQKGSRTTKKGDKTLLGEKRLVSFGTAEQYLGIGERQRQKLVNSGALKVEGQGQNRKVTAESLKAYLPPEIPN